MKKQHPFLRGDWEDFELDFYDSYVPKWKQNIACVVADLFVHRIKIRMSTAELAKKIGTSESAITRFERMGRVPTLEFIYRIAKGLGVSIQGLSLKSIDASDNNIDMSQLDRMQQWKKDMISIAHELNEHRIKANISKAELAATMGTSVSAIARFEKVDRVPSFQFVYRVAEGLGLEMEPLSVMIT